MDKPTNFDQVVAALKATLGYKASALTFDFLEQKPWWGWATLGIFAATYRYLIVNFKGNYFMKCAYDDAARNIPLAAREISDYLTQHPNGLDEDGY
jgi:hypothetical protein